MSYDRSYFIRNLREKWRNGELSQEQIRRLVDIGFPFEGNGIKHIPVPVVCLETGQRYDSIGTAAKETGVQRNELRTAIKNGYLIHGYHFYREDCPKPSDDFFKPYYGRHDKIECVETRKCFDTLKAAAQSVGLKRGESIRQALNSGGAAGGCHWKYHNEEEDDTQYKRTMMRNVPIMCVETGKVFDNLAEASREADCDPSLIRAAIRRKGTCRGLHWMYFDENSEADISLFPPDPRLVPVRCIETGAIFASIKEAALFAGVRQSNISAVVRHRQKTAGGYHWEYVDSDDTREEKKETN